MKIYVVISDSIIDNHSSHGLHGVYKNLSDAKTAAISTIINTAQKHGYSITNDSITIDGNELFYVQNDIDIVVSCIEQDLR